MKSLRRVSTSSSSSSSSYSSWNHLRSVLYVVASSPVSNRVHLKSPWFRRRRKHVLSPEKWNGLFFEDGRLKNEAKFLKIVRSGGVDPSIRAKVWPFLLGVYDINSSEEQRSLTQAQNRREYEGLRKECLCLSNLNSNYKNRIDSVCCNNVKNGCLGAELNDDPDSLGSDCASKPLSIDGGGQEGQDLYSPTFDDVSLSNQLFEEDDEEEKDDVSLEGSRAETYSLGSRSSDSLSEERERNIPTVSKVGPSSEDTAENFTTWRRIIHLDALRVNMEWEMCLSSRTIVSDKTACLLAESVGLKDYDNLDPSRIFHAARLVAILEAYAIYDPDIGYCQGMSDLLSPIVAVIEEDHEAFWCFVAFMKKARNNFMLDETGIRRQLNIVSKIIRSKDSHLYKHLAKLKAEDCCFVYRMVVVLFRRELSFEQTLCLWEVIWADQAAIRVGIGKSSWSRIRLQAPPTDDLLLYAIAACVLQRRKLIIERYNSMDEILKECNSMTGQLDVWKLLDDAHDLVVTLHDKI